MKFGYSETCLAHDTGARHPESPDRLRAIREGLKRKHGVEYVDADPAPRSAITAIHDDAYVDQFEDFCADGGGEWDPDTVAVEATWEAALQSTGLALWAVDRALAGADGRDTPFALGRPPGHHAVEADAMGFCFFNNAAIAADYAIRTTDVERVAIVDWDVHHGNGTQDLLYDRGDVCYVSTHEDGLYPGTGEVPETGTGDGAGATVNIPMPAGAGDTDYTTAFERVVEPAIAEYDPDLLLVSAGFDAHRHDPISRTRVSTDGFGRLTMRLRTVASDTDAALAFVLEGGYGMETLSESVAMVHDIFDGYTPPEPDGVLEDGVDDLLSQLERLHSLDP